MTEEAAERRAMSIDVLKAGGFYQQNYVPQSINKNKEKGGEIPFNLNVSNEGKAPYSYLAKGGIIEYNGVQFVCDMKRNMLYLGDVSNPENCITIPLSEGGSLVVNRDELGSLSKAISMFSPEDINRIMRAIATDAKVLQKEKEIEEEIYHTLVRR